MRELEGRLKDETERIDKAEQAVKYIQEEFRSMDSKDGKLQAIISEQRVEIHEMRKRLRENDLTAVTAQSLKRPAKDTV